MGSELQFCKIENAVWMDGGDMKVLNATELHA